MPSRKRTILLVDDEADFRDITAELLEEHGYSVSTAADGELAVEHLSEAPPPDLIVLDLKMPKTDGWGVFVWLKGHKRLKGVPVLIVSGAHLDAEMFERINRHAPFWLQKPVDPKDLLSAIKQHLK